MDAALRQRSLNPSDSIRTAAKDNGVARSTLHDRETGLHAPRGVRTRRNLSVEQEQALVAEINRYADRGTMLEPRHITELAQALGKCEIGKNWTSTFLRRQKDHIVARFFSIQQASRLKADVYETRRAFFTLVGVSARI